MDVLRDLFAYAGAFLYWSCGMYLALLAILFLVYLAVRVVMAIVRKGRR